MTRAFTRAGVSGFLERHNRTLTITAAISILFFDRILPGFIYVGAAYVLVVALQPLGSA